jgi:hypothetical protein
VSRRTTLRPIEGPAAEMGAPVTVPPSPSPVVGAWGISRNTLMACVLTVSGAVLVGGLALAGRSTPASPPGPAPAAVSIAAPATTACPSVASFLDVLTAYERQARWGLAASTAQTALRTPALCESDRAALGQKLVALSREALFEQPPAPEDAPGQRRVATAYADLKTLSVQYRVQPPPPLPIARSAYDNRLFLLATVAYADAFTNGDSSVEDREVVRADYAAQYNLGLIWSQRTDVTQRQEGLARLATACRIDERDQLGSPEACTKLQALLGPRNRWPAPLAEPLIDMLPRVTAAPGS